VGIRYRIKITIIYNALIDVVNLRGLRDKEKEEQRKCKKVQMSWNT